MLTKRDIEILTYEALSILEATNLGPLFFSAKSDGDELLESLPSAFDEPEYAAEVQIAIKNLKEHARSLGLA